MQNEDDFLQASIQQVRKWRSIIDILRPPCQSHENPLRSALAQFKTFAAENNRPDLESLVDKILDPENETALCREILAVSHEAKAVLLSRGVHLEDPVIHRLSALISKIE